MASTGRPAPDSQREIVLWVKPGTSPWSQSRRTSHPRNTAPMAFLRLIGPRSVALARREGATAASEAIQGLYAQRIFASSGYAEGVDRHPRFAYSTHMANSRPGLTRGAVAL